MDDNVKKIIELSKEGYSEDLVSKIIANPKMENLIRANSATVLLEADLADKKITLRQLEEKTTSTHTEIVQRVQLRRQIAELQQQIDG